MEIPKKIPNVRQQGVKIQAEQTKGSFREILSGTLVSKKQAADQHQKMSNLFEIGTITKQTPTVSELLLKNEEFKGATWNILAAHQNQGKDYRAIQPETKIYINRKSGELFWLGATKKQPTKQLQEGSGESKVTTLTGRQMQESGPALKDTSRTVITEQVRLGIISSDTPTVSHLLHRNSRFSDQTWEILGQTVNANKHFHSMHAGSEVSLNLTTMEITWRSSDSEPVQTVVPVEVKEESSKKEILHSHEPITNLSQAVQPYMGKSYKEIDCYELLVNGLKQLDIPYGGRNGLYSKLTQKALDRGMATNAYLNGEGIVEVAGSTLLSKKYSKLTNWQEHSADLIREIEPLLNTGQILSFSTQTSGHTGIVSRQDDRWTFINSGRLDNTIAEHALDKGVGEEILDKEIRNWFALAHKSGESLRVTLGELDQKKNRTAAIPAKLAVNRI